LLLPGLALIGIGVALERRADRITVRRLLALDPPRSWGMWALPAPESYVLFRGEQRESEDAFKLGLLQLVAAGVLRPVKDLDPSRRGRVTFLERASVSTEALAGSLAPIYDLWALPSETLLEIQTLAKRAKQKYGSLDGLETKVVLPELVKAGLCRPFVAAPGKTSTELTSEGKAARADLESRMGGVLREMQLRRGSEIYRKPSRTLMAAVISVAVGGSRPPEEADLQRVGQQVEEGVVAGQDNGSQTGAWLNWYAFDQFASCFQAIDSGVDAAGSGALSSDSGGDGGDGGVDGGGDAG
jgi:hypothetical protein